MWKDDGSRHEPLRMLQLVPRSVLALVHVEYRVGRAACLGYDGDRPLDITSRAFKQEPYPFYAWLQAEQPYFEPTGTAGYAGRGDFNLLLRRHSHPQLQRNNRINSTIVFSDHLCYTAYKSGTTWMLEIVHRLMFLETTPPPNQEYWIDARWSPLDQVMHELAAQTRPRLLKTHLPLDGLPYFPQVKYIVVGRDGRDVFMSLWNHYANYTQQFYSRINDTPGRVGEPLPACPQDIHEFWRMWSTRGWFEWESEGYPFWGNFHHTQSWWEYRALDNILFVHFNDLLLDLVGEIRRVAHFLGIAVSEAALTALTQAVTLTAMRRDAESLYPDLGQYWQGGVQTFYFKGTNGRWKVVLSEAELQMYEQAKTRVLTPDCARWLEQGCSSFSAI